MKVRLIIQSNHDGTSEYVTFTDDFKTKSEDFLYPDHRIDFDKMIEMDEVAGFPLNYDLKRVNI
jgi:hypothetical protein